MSRGVVPGRAIAETLVLEEPLSLWGGVDTTSGRIVEKGHPQCGERLGGRILVLDHGRGSSSSSSVLAEMLRLGVGPVGIVLRENDSILAIGALVAQALYGTVCPVVVATEPLAAGLVEIDGEKGIVMLALENPGEDADNSDH